MNRQPFSTSCRVTFVVFTLLVAATAGLWPVAPAAAQDEEPATGILTGFVLDALTEAPLAGVTVEIQPPPGNTSFDWTPAIAETDDSGEYTLGNAPVGDWPVMASHPAYGSQVKLADIQAGATTRLDFHLGLSSDAVGSIAGTVLHGLTGEPVAGAAISVEGIATLAPVVTDEFGQFRFDGVPTGARTVTAGKDGFEPARALAHVTAGGVAQVDLTLFPLGGLGQGRIEGVVYDAANGEPVQSVTVQLVSAMDFGVPRTAYTNAKGVFVFADVESGIYGLHTQMRGYQAASTEVLVEPEVTVSVELRIVPIGPVISGSVSGRVIDARTQEPISGAGVGFDNAPTHVWVLSDPEGAFFFGGVAVGPGRVHAYHAGYEPGSVEVAIEPDTNADITIALEPILPPAVGGVSGVVTDSETGAALQGAAIHFDANGVSVRVVTDSEGRYGFGGVPAGPNFVRANYPGYELQAVDCDVPAGGVARVDIALVRGGTPGTGAIAGRVLDAETGEPLSARVYYTPEGNTWPDDSWWGGEGWPSVTDLPFVETDERGAYLIEGLRRGYYMLRAESTGYLGLRQFVAVNEDAVTVMDFDLRPFVAPETGGLEGTVFDEETGDPVAGAWVEWRWEPVDCWTEDGSDCSVPWPGNRYAGAVQTDDEGMFKVSDLYPGLYSLNTRAEGYEPVWTTAEVVELTTSTLEIALRAVTPPEPGIIMGWVMSAVDDAPIPGARVTWNMAADDTLGIDWRTPGGSDAGEPPAVDETGEPLPPENSVLTDADGYYEIPDLAQGVYLLLVEAEGFAAQRRLVWVGAGQTVEATFRLRPVVEGFGNVEGVVTDAETGDVLPGVAVWAVPWGPITIAGAVPSVVLGMTETDSEGHYLLEDLPAGFLVLHAALDGYRPAGQTVEVLPSETVEANFALRPEDPTLTGNISGLVHDARTGLPVEGAVVVLNPEDAAVFEVSHRLDLERRVVTDDQGFFLFERVPVGDYLVGFRARGYLPMEMPAHVTEGETFDMAVPLEPAPEPPTGEITGTVLDDAGDPVSSATIRLQPLDVTATACGDCLTTETNAAGAYRLPGAPAGPCVVYALRRGYLPAKQEVEVPVDGVVVCDFTLTPITAGGAIAGVVRDALTGEPLEDVLVAAPHLNLQYLINADNAAFDRTDAEGRYRIEPVPAGEQVVVAISAAYYQDAQLAMVEEGATTTVDFDLIPKQNAATLWIRAWQGAEQTPLGGVEVELSQSDWVEVGSSWNPWRDTTDDTGEASVPNVDPQGQMVRVLVEDYGTIEVPVPAAGSGRGVAAIPAVERPRAGEPLSLITLCLGWDSAQGETERLTWQWRKNGVAIPGATEPELDTSECVSGDVLTCQVALWVDSQLVAVAVSGAATIAPPDGAGAGDYWVLFD